MHMKVNIVLSRSLKELYWNYEENVLNLHIAFGKMAIFTMLTLLIPVHGRYFNLLIAYSIYFFRHFKLLSYRSFTCLASVTPNMFYIICGYSEGCCFPDFFFNLFVICSMMDS